MRGLRCATRPSGLAGPYRHVNIWLLFAGGEKSNASIIRATCTFDTKKVLSDNNVIAVTLYTVSNKKILLFFDFCSEVSAFLVEN